MATITTGYVRTQSGSWLVQKPDDNQFGFSLFSDDQVFPGGFGIDEWQLVPAKRVPVRVRRELGWLIQEEVAR